MRTTVDLPEELHRIASSIARDTSKSFSATVAELMRRGLRSAPEPTVSRSARTGLPVVTLGRPLTTEDVRALEDDE